MNDLFLELGKNPTARNVIKSLGLPIPMPRELKRPAGPRVERELENRRVAVGGASSGEVVHALASALARAGASPAVAGTDVEVEPFEGPGDAYGRPPVRLDETGEIDFHGLVFDATGFSSIDDLKQLYDFYHPLVGRMKACSRIVVVGRPVESAETDAQAAARAALDGFVRSLAKEIGKKGSTANLLLVEDGADEALAGPLRFLLSDRSAYVSGQPLGVTGIAGHEDDPVWTFPLEGKVALVTGAARGIGRETAKILAAEGAKVVVLDLPSDDAPASRLAREIDGGILLVDVTEPDAPETIAETLSEEYGGVDIVVHNAGITRDKTLKRMKEAFWEQTISVNLEAVATISERLLEDRVMHDGGRFICLSSIAGIAGNMGQTNYAASKAGIIGFVRHLSRRTAERRITVNAIAPGFIETRLTDAIPFAIREAARRMNNLGQGGQPSDIGEAVAFLATPGAQGVSGEVLRVCGGSLVGR